MKIHYFDDTDTLYIEFRAEGIVDTRDLDDDTILDVDADGQVCALTLERASQRTDLHPLAVEGLVAAKAAVAASTTPMATATSPAPARRWRRSSRYCNSPA